MSIFICYNKPGTLDKIFLWILCLFWLFSFRLLDYNFLKVVSKSWQYGLETLKELSISHNYIEKIDEDSWEFCRTLFLLWVKYFKFFTLFIKLYFFSDLSFNALQSIESDTFKNLEHLQKLSLNNNNISFIKENAFVHLPKLRFL